MSLRLPRSLAEGRGGGGPVAIEAEVIAEKAASLGNAGRRLEKALARLRGAPADGDPEALIDAAELAWAFLTQRELCGLRNNRRAIADFAIPAAVMARVGAARRRGP